ncbi:MAG: PEGA domain-containing protein [Acidobacteriia bacterium]|nr:PEGA domain-containing protein [Terriglobia bacterium]
MLQPLQWTSIILAMALFATPAFSGATQTPAAPSTRPDITSLQKALDQAKSDFDSNFKGAMEQVAALIKQLDETIAAQQPLSVEERKVYEEALLLEARGNLRVLKNEAAADDFRKLLRLNPNFAAETLTPRENQTLEDIRQNEMGAIEVQGQPQGARISVNQQEKGVLQPIAQRWRLFPGHYVVLIEKLDFAPERREFDLAAKQILSWTDIQLLRLRIPLVLFFDQPSVETWGGDKRLDTSRPLREVVQSLAPPLGQFAQQQAMLSGWDPARMSAVAIPNFDVSTSREIIFKKECFLPETRRFEIPVESLRKLNEQTPLWIDPTLSFISLRANQGTLAMTSMPSPASVLLGGKSLGPTPLKQTVCAGKHVLVVRTADEGYEAPVEIVRDGTLSIEARLKPTLAVVVVDRAQTGNISVTHLAEAGDRLKATLDRFFVIPVKLPERDRELQRLSLTEETLRDAFHGIEPTGQAPQPIPGALQQMARNFGASLLLLGFPEGEDQTTWVLLSIESSRLDVVRLRSASSDEMVASLKQLNEPSHVEEALFQPDLGLRTIDTNLPTAPLVVVRVWPASPAEQAGIRVGDIILSVNGTKMETNQLQLATAQAPPGTRFSMEIRGADGGQKAAVLASTNEPVVWPLSPAASNAFFEQFIARLRDALDGTKPPPLENLIRLNLAVALMRGDRFAEALNVLSKIASGRFPGTLAGRITDATALYLTGRGEEALGMKEKSKATYEKAAQSNCEDCIVDSVDVEPASAAARRRLSVLGSAK